MAQDKTSSRRNVLGRSSIFTPEVMPGLRSKAFTYDPESGTATNFYVWESEAAARAFFSPELAERVTGLYGVAPEVRFVEIAALVENGVATPA